MTFKELYLSGQVPFEEIDRYISRWNRSDDERTLAKYLGLNADEEDVWIDDSDEALKEMLDARERVAGTPVTLGKTDIIVNKMDLARCQSSVFLLMMRRYCFARRMTRVSVSLIRRAFIRTVRRRSAMR